MIRKVRNCCETCENLVRVAATIGQLQHTEYLKPTFLDTFKWAIRPVFPETVTYCDSTGTLIIPNKETTVHYHCQVQCAKAAEPAFIPSPLRILTDIYSHLLPVHWEYLHLF